MGMLFYKIAIVLVAVSSVKGTDPGFELFFSTNLDEMTDVEIHFQHPLPSWLKGTLVRNGLGRFEMKKRQFLHAFDAFGKLSSWRFPGNGSAFFSTRFLQSDFYKASVASDDVAPYLMFEGVTPKFNEIEKVEALTRGIDNMNVNVYCIYNVDERQYEYVALNDFWKMYKFHPQNLTTIGSVTAPVPTKNVVGKFAFLSFLSSAHPLPEFGTDNHFTYVSSVSLVPWQKSTISLIRINSVEKRHLVAKWSVDKVPYMHSFSITENYAIFFASPFYVNVEKMIKSAEPIDSLDWFEDEKTDIFVIDIRTGEVFNLKTDNMFSMHHVNAFETENGEIIVDISSYPSPAFVKNLEISVLRDPVKRNQFDAHALLKRYVINLSTKDIQLSHFEPSIKVPFSTLIDMPVINENYRYKQYCYVYGLILKKDNITLSHIALAKKNLCGNNELDEAWYTEGHYPVEPWFVPFPGGKAEDDGYLMVPILNGFNQTSYIAIIDARTMKTVNQANNPTIVPYSLHGRFFDEVS